MQAIVLVGGEGTRLRPLTSSIPKPALTLVDRPFLAYMIEWLAGHGVTEVVLACGFLPDQLREALGDDERHGARVRYVVEPERRGTAGGIRYAADELGDDLGERFLALNGDVLNDLDLTALLRAHEERGARATLALHAVEDSAVYGLVSCDEDGAVTAFTEKTGNSVPGEVNAGSYVLERSVLDLIPSDREVSIEREVFPLLVGDGLHALCLDGYWMDIGTPDRYLGASWDILEGRVQTRVKPNAPGLFVGAGAEIARGATIGPRAVIAPGCKVADGATVRGSVLLDGCTVAAGATVEDSILAPGVAVGAGGTVSGAMIGQVPAAPAAESN
jgi:mannose-1-phosphate guanylyltransferase